MGEAIRNEERGGLTVHACNDCGAWCRPGERIRHSKRCDTPTAQASEWSGPTASAPPAASKPVGRRLSIPEIQRLAREGEIAHAGLTEDEVVKMVDRGHISVSDAMNRDF